MLIITSIIIMKDLNNNLLINLWYIILKFLIIISTVYFANRNDLYIQINNYKNKLNYL